jgi:hypothetical protein
MFGGLRNSGAMPLVAPGGCRRLLNYTNVKL